MIHDNAVVTRVKELIESKGVRLRLGLNTLQHGTLERIPVQKDALTAWLPGILVDVPICDFAPPVGDRYDGFAQQRYLVNIYWVRRYSSDEVIARENSTHLNDIGVVFDNSSWVDRLTDEYQCKVKYARQIQVDKRPPEFEYLRSTLSDITVAAVRGEVVLIALR